MTTLLHLFFGPFPYGDFGGNSLVNIDPLWIKEF